MVLLFLTDPNRKTFTIERPQVYTGRLAYAAKQIVRHYFEIAENTMAFVFDQSGECRGHSGGGSVSPSGNGVVITGSVGRGGRNLRNDVLAIQDALNKIDIINGGPMPPLVVDGFVGPKTIGAIEHFQRVQFPQKPPDGRIDPGQRTISRINELLSRSGPVAAGPGGTGGFTSPGSKLGFTQVSHVTQTSTTDAQIQLAETLALDAEKRLSAALKRMGQAVTALGKSKRTTAEEELVREINWHFKASADPDPKAHMLKVQAILLFMHTAVREQNQGIRNIFRKGTHPDPTAIAAAELGGWHSMKQDERFIIITPNFRTQSSGVIVHELGHFCGGNRTSGKDVVHRASPKPFPTGTQKEDGNSNYRDMSPFHARTNVFSYQIYCFPEAAEFKVP